MLKLCVALSLTLLVGAGAAPAAVASTAVVDAKAPVTPAYVDKLTRVFEQMHYTEVSKLILSRMAEKSALMKDLLPTLTPHFNAANFARAMAPNMATDITPEDLAKLSDLLKSAGAQKVFTNISKGVTPRELINFELNDADRFDLNVVNRAPVWSKFMRALRRVDMDALGDEMMEKPTKVVVKRMNAAIGQAVARANAQPEVAGGVQIRSVGTTLIDKIAQASVDSEMELGAMFQRYDELARNAGLDHLLTPAALAVPDQRARALAQLDKLRSALKILLRDANANLDYRPSRLAAVIGMRDPYLTHFLPSFVGPRDFLTRYGAASQRAIDDTWRVLAFLDAHASSVRLSPNGNLRMESGGDDSTLGELLLDMAESQDALAHLVRSQKQLDMLLVPWQGSTPLTGAGKS